MSKRRIVRGILLLVVGVVISRAGTRLAYRAIRNLWAGHFSREKGVCYPATLPELREIVQEAKRSWQKICLAGAGLSQNGQNRGGDGFVRVKLDLMNAVVIDPVREVATVRGNVTFADLEEAANKHGLAVKVRQASNIFGILSSISTNVHGWDLRSGCIGDTVNSITVLNEDSKSQTFVPGTEGYKTSVGSFGGVYLIYEAEIQLTKNILLRKEGRCFDTLKDALGNFRDNLRTADLGLIKVGREKFYTLMHYPISTSGSASCIPIREEKTGSYLERLLVDISRLMMLIKMRKPLDRLYVWIMESKWNKTGEGLRNEMMAAHVNAIYKRFKGIFATHEFWLVEYFVQEKHLEGLIALYKEQYEDTFVINIAIRYVPKYVETYAHYAGTNVFSVVICWDQIMNDEHIKKSEKRNDAFLEYLYKRGGKFYLAYKNKTADMVKFYPEFASMIKKKRTVFSNEMIERIYSYR